MYGTGDYNAWDNPLVDKDEENPPIPPLQLRIDLTKVDIETMESTDTISQITQDLIFLRKDFNDSI